ncbi:MAG: asparagine synthase-related protein [Bdellovibrionales bacterium]
MQGPPSFRVREASDQVFELVKGAVFDRLLSSRKNTGLLLSGGLDSSTIGAMCNAIGQPFEDTLRILMMQRPVKGGVWTYKAKQ